MILTILIWVWCVTAGILLGRFALDAMRGFRYGPRTFDDIILVANIASACFFVAVKVLS